jgi:ubiquinone/menaquinone biosynthesis C-methylase UbiE
VPDKAAGSGGWASPDTAEAYARFCAEYPLYRLASEDVAAAAGVDTAGLVIDLACGTGATSEVILDRLPGNGRLVAVDSSAAMLAAARARLADPRLSWVHARAEDLASHVAGPADAVVCSSAIWQTDMPVAFAAVRQVLRPGGRFAFNIGADCMTMPDDAPAQPDTELSLLELTRQAAISSGWEPSEWRQPAGRQPRAEITVESVTGMLAAAGFGAPRADAVEYRTDQGMTRAWLSIPIFTERWFPGLSYERRMDALATACQQLDTTQPDVSQWMLFTATATATAAPGD